eukprot:Nk52_evm13s2579 gene=Nk52_evmTU13s2579
MQSPSVSAGPSKAATYEQLQDFCKFLQTKYNDLLEKHSEAESTIDDLKTRRLSFNGVGSSGKLATSGEMSYRQELQQLRMENQQLKEHVVKYESGYGKLSKECEGLNTKYSLSTVAIETLKQEKRTLARLLQKERARSHGHGGGVEGSSPHVSMINVSGGEEFIRDHSARLDELREMKERGQDHIAAFAAANPNSVEQGLLGDLTVLTQMQDLVVSYQESLCEEGEDRKTSEMGLEGYAVEYRHALFEFISDITEQLRKSSEGSTVPIEEIQQHVKKALTMLQEESHRLNVHVQLEDELKERFKENYIAVKRNFETLPRIYDKMPQPTKENLKISRNNKESALAKAVKTFEISADTLIDEAQKEVEEENGVNALNHLDFTQSMEQFQAIDDHFHLVSRLAIADDKLLEQTEDIVHEYQTEHQHALDEIRNLRQECDSLKDAYNKELEAQNILELRLKAVANQSAQHNENVREKTDQISDEQMQTFLHANIGKNTNVDKLLNKLSEIITLYSDRFNILKKQLQQQTEISDKLDITSKAIGSLQVQSHHLMSSLKGGSSGGRGGSMSMGDIGRGKSFDTFYAPSQSPRTSPNASAYLHHHRESQHGYYAHTPPSRWHGSSLLAHENGHGEYRPRYLSGPAGQYRSMY